MHKSSLFPNANSSGRGSKAETLLCSLSLKVSEKGAVSLYGRGRFPVTLYKEQWLSILDSAPLTEPLPAQPN
jgi:hypothetical protein